MTKQILEKHGYEEKIINEVVHCVKTHRYRSNNIPETIEAKILFDADKLDAIGAVGIGRAFLFSGEVGARMHDPDIDIGKTEMYSRDDTAYREFLVKLQFIKDRLLTKEGRKIAQERHKFMLKFFERLNRESKGKL